MLKTEDEVKAWLDKYKIKNYTINNDLTVDVEGNVDLASMHIKELPVQFGVVTGEFDISYNKNFKSLKGVPKEVHNFFCVETSIETLEDGPEKVEKCYYVHSNKLKTLKGAPKKVITLQLSHNTELNSFLYAPECNNNVSTTKTKLILSAPSKYKELIKNVGYDQCQEIWPCIEKMISLGKQ